MRNNVFFLVWLLIASTVTYAERVIRIGAPLPLTGNLALEAAKQKRGYDLWADRVNTSGGIDVSGVYHSVKIIYKDYQSNGSKVFETIDGLIRNSNVDLIFAPYGSKAARDASVITEKYRIPMIAITASSSQTYSRGHDYIFGIFTPNRTLIEPLMDVVTQESPDINNIALIVRDDLFPQSIAREIMMASRERNLNIIFHKRYAVGMTDYSMLLEKLEHAAPNWIFALGYTEDLILLRKQMYNFNIEVPVLTMIAAPAYQEFIDATGSLAEYITSSAWWHPAVKYSGNDIFGTTEQFVQSFENRYGFKPDYVEATAAVGGVLFQLAIERAGSFDGELVREELSKINETTFWGPIRFGPNGQNNAPSPLVFQIKQGEAVVIHPQGIATGKLKLAPTSSD